jgi:predicted permease
MTTHSIYLSKFTLISSVAIAILVNVTGLTKLFIHEKCSERLARESYTNGGHISIPRPEGYPCVSDVEHYISLTTATILAVAIFLLLLNPFLIEQKQLPLKQEFWKKLKTSIGIITIGSSLPFLVSIGFSIFKDLSLKIPWNMIIHSEDYIMYCFIYVLIIIFCLIQAGISTLIHRRFPSNRPIIVLLRTIGGALLSILLWSILAFASFTIRNQLFSQPY